MCNYCGAVGIKDFAPDELSHYDLNGHINNLKIYLGCVSIWINDDGKLTIGYENDDCGAVYTSDDLKKEEINFCPKCGEDLRLIKKLRDKGADLEFCFQDDLQGQNICDAIKEENTNELNDSSCG